MKEDVVKQFPPRQMVLLDDKREYEETRGEIMKEIMLPWWQLNLQLDVPRKRTDSLLCQLVSAGLKIRNAQARLELRIALLRHIEAIRLYVAANGGKLPEKLTDLKVPLPMNPFDGGPFSYKLENGIARLWGTPPPGADKSPMLKVQYELTVRK